MKLEPIKTWERAPNYLELDWREIADADLTTPFIRVGGTAAASEAEAVVNALSATRRASSAFIVSNAVRVDGMAEMEGLAELGADAIKSFDVLQALLDELTTQEQAVVNQLLED